MLALRIKIKVQPKKPSPGVTPRLYPVVEPSTKRHPVESFVAVFSWKKSDMLDFVGWVF
jgi:hypothetical protein